MTEIDALRLPSIAFERRGALAPVPSVYFLIERDLEVIYIGQSMNLRSRWRSHECLKGYPSITGLRIAWIEIEDDMARCRTERSLIGRYRPRLNYAYNPQLLLPPANPEDVIDDVIDVVEDGDLLLTTTQAAKRLGISTARVRQLILGGRLPAGRFGRDHQIREADLAKVKNRKHGRPKKK